MQVINNIGLLTELLGVRTAVVMACCEVVSRGFLLTAHCSLLQNRMAAALTVIGGPFVERAVVVVKDEVLAFIRS